MNENEIRTVVISNSRSMFINWCASEGLSPNNPSVVSITCSDDIHRRMRGRTVAADAQLLRIGIPFCRDWDLQVEAETVMEFLIHRRR